MQSTAQSKPIEQPRTPAAKQQPKRQVPPAEFQAEKILRMAPADLVNLLKDPAATEFQKAKACQRLASVGTKEAVPALAALLADPQLAHYARYGLETNLDSSADDALRGALGKISGLEAVVALEQGLRRAQGAVRSAVAGAGLVCAEGLLAQGQRDPALALYTTLSGADIPKPVRLAAMRGIIAAETSLGRPR